MIGGDIRSRLLIDNAEGASGPHAQWVLSICVETPGGGHHLPSGRHAARLGNPQEETTTWQATINLISRR